MGVSEAGKKGGKSAWREHAHAASGLLKRTIFVRVPVRSYWLIAAYCGFLLFLFMFRNAAEILSIRGFWLFFALALVGAYAVYRFHSIVPEQFRVPLQISLFLLLSNLFLFDSSFNLFNVFTVVCISLVMGAMLYGLRGAVGLAAFESGVLYYLMVTQNRGGPEGFALFGDLTASLWLLAIFTGVVAEVFHEKARENSRLRELVERQERLSSLGELTGGLAHELRNPLLIIKGAGELIAQGDDPAESKELAEYIIGEVQRLNGLITSLLDFAKPEKTEMLVMDLNEVTEKAVTEARLFIESAKRPIQVHFQSGAMLKVLGDPGFLHQVFTNLFLNAIEAIPTAGQIWVKSGRDSESGGSWVEIRDNGVGISDQDLKKIFNPFFSLRQKGVGLGLSVTQRILDAHGARVDVESELGHGTTFVIHFPEVPESHQVQEVIHL